MSFLVLGESLVDLISEPGGWRFEAAPGGSPLNVAVGLAAAGHRVRLATELGDDLFGGLVREHLVRYGVADSDLATTAVPTSLAFARLDADGVAGYDFRLGWTWAGQPDLAGVACLHIGSLGAVLAPGAAAVRETVTAARQRGVPVSYDPNVRPALMGEAAIGAIEELVGLADLVKVSSEDLAWLAPGEPDLVAAARWARSGPRLVVVTRGGEGAVALHNGYEIGCAAPPVEVVDTVGAGDAFTAGLLSSLVSSAKLASRTNNPAAKLASRTNNPAAKPANQTDNPTAKPANRTDDAAGALAEPTRAQVAAALRQANAVAAAVCAHRGAAPPAPDTVSALIEKTRLHG